MGGARRVVDIGCEHGQLGALLAARGCRVIGIERRAALLRPPAYRGPAPRVLGDGPTCLAPGAEVVVAAGLGERSLAAWLDHPLLTASRRLVLGPSPQPYRLRAELERHGWYCAAEDLVHSGGRFHVLIAAERGAEPSTEPDARLLGPRLVAGGHPLLRPWLEDLLRRRPHARGDSAETALLAAARRLLDLAP